MGALEVGKPGIVDGGVVVEFLLATAHQFLECALDGVAGTLGAEALEEFVGAMSGLGVMGVASQYGTQADFSQRRVADFGSFLGPDNPESGKLGTRRTHANPQVPLEAVVCA